jgi:hypothetical protein
MIIVTLSNGKRVGNFSSPHPFTFEDGTVLPAVSSDEAKKLSVTFNEIEVFSDCTGGDIELTFDLEDHVIDHMNMWINLHQEDKVDIIFCPLPMITAIRHHFGRDYLLNNPFRAIRMTDRINKLVSISKQCI